MIPLRSRVHIAVEDPSKPSETPLKEVAVGTLGGEPLRANFPLRVELFGVDAIVIPATEYDRLRTIEASRTQRLLKPRSRIDADPEVADFIAAKLGTVYLDDVVRLCLERFGAERAPSRSAVDRFRHRLEAARAEAAPEGGRGRTVARRGGLRRGKKSYPPAPSTLEQDDPEAAAFLRARFDEGVSIEVARSKARHQLGRALSYQRCRSFWHLITTAG